MSLLDDFAHKCVLMEKKRTPDGAGGYITAWEEGAEFLNYQSLDTSMEARKAEKDGVTSVYSAPVSYTHLAAMTLWKFTVAFIKKTKSTVLTMMFVSVFLMGRLSVLAIPKRT